MRQLRSVDSTPHASGSKFGGLGDTWDARFTRAAFNATISRRARALAIIDREGVPAGSVSSRLAGYMSGVWYASFSARLTLVGWIPDQRERIWHNESS
jgi:hypothetical protein